MSVLSDEKLVRISIDAMAKVFPEAKTGLEEALADLAAGDTETIAMVAALRAVAEAAIAADRAAKADPVAYRVSREGGYNCFISAIDTEMLELARLSGYLVEPLYTAQPAAHVPENVAKDAERYRWLKARMVGVSFDWDEEGMVALAFEMPDGCAFGADCDKNIDDAMLAATTAPSQEHEQ